MLSIVDDELRRHGDNELSKVAMRTGLGEGLETHVAVNGCCDGRKDVLLRVFDDVLGDLRDTRAVKGSLSPQFGRNFILVVQENLRDELERAHRYVVLATGL